MFSGDIEYVARSSYGYYFESSIRAISCVSYAGMIEVMPTSSSVSLTSGVRLQRANFPLPSSVRCAMSAIYPIDLLLRYLSPEKLKSVLAREKSPIAEMILGNVLSTLVSSSSPSKENIFTPVLVEAVLISR